MGLDITAYRNLTEVRSPRDEDDDGYDDNLVRLYENPGFSGRAEGVNCAMLFAAAEEFNFRAGSYSGYNRWREWLSSIVGTTPERVWGGDTPAAFGELILFSDCEGTIGPVVAARLAKDFADYEAEAVAVGDEYTVQVYRHFRRAFEMAADRGAVSFH